VSNYQAAIERCAQPGVARHPTQSSGQSGVTRPTGVGTNIPAGISEATYRLQRRIGFVHPGQDADIKVETFTFTRYGLFHGKVLNVSHARQTAGQAERKRMPGADNANSGPRARSIPMRRGLARTQMQIDDNLINFGDNVSRLASSLAWPPDTSARDVIPSQHPVVVVTPAPVRDWRADEVRLFAERPQC
jgi:hypothetical protein